MWLTPFEFRDYSIFKVFFWHNHQTSKFLITWNLCFKCKHSACNQGSTAWDMATTTPPPSNVKFIALIEAEVFFSFSFICTYNIKILGYPKNPKKWFQSLSFFCWHAYTCIYILSELYQNMHIIRIGKYGSIASGQMHPCVWVDFCTRLLWNASVHVKSHYYIYEPSLLFAKRTCNVCSW